MAGVASCSNEELVNAGTVKRGNLMLSATIGNSSRTNVDDNGDVNWVQGDQFYAWGNGSDATFTLHEGEGTQNGLFSGTLHNGFAEELYHVVYPAAAVEVGGTGTYIDLKNVTYGNSSAPMYGVIESGKVTFDNLTAMLRIRIKGIPADATLSVTGIGIAGKATLSNGALCDYSDEENTVTVTGIKADAEYVDVPVYAVGERQISIRVNGSDAYIVSLNLEKGKVYQSPIPELSYVNDDLAMIWDGTIDTNWYEESMDEFVLTNPAQLAGLSKIVAGDSESGNNFRNKTIILGASFDMNDLNFETIGKYGSSYSFSGTFDGGNHTISGLHVEGGVYAGLFGSLGSATIKDLSITNSYFEGDNCGCVAAYLYGESSIENVAVTNSVAVENDVEYSNRLIGSGRSTSGSVSVDGQQYVFIKTNDDFKTAINNGSEYIELSAGSYTLPNVAADKTLTISGTEETKISVTSGLTYAKGATITFNGITIQSEPEGEGYTNGFADFKYAYFNNCVINGTLGLDFSCEFNTCVFNIEGNYYNVWTWGAGTVSFTGCTFNTDGKALLVYANVLDNNSNHQTVNVNGCVFNDNGDDTVTGKAAIEITNTYSPVRTYDVFINETTVNGFAQTVPGKDDFNAEYGSVEGSDIGTNVWGNKMQLPKTQVNVVIDGVDVY